MTNDRITILDKNRKAFLTLPVEALKLWMTYWMNEDEEQESFMSQGEIATQNGQGLTTISKWTAYLVGQGWLVDTGKTAYDKPTNYYFLDASLAPIPSKCMYTK